VATTNNSSTRKKKLLEEEKWKFQQPSNMLQQQYEQMEKQIADQKLQLHQAEEEHRQLQQREKEKQKQQQINLQHEKELLEEEKRKIQSAKEDHEESLKNFKKKAIEANRQFYAKVDTANQEQRGKEVNFQIEKQNFEKTQKERQQELKQQESHLQHQRKLFEDERKKFLELSHQNESNSEEVVADQKEKKKLPKPEDDFHNKDLQPRQQQTKPSPNEKGKKYAVSTSVATWEEKIAKTPAKQVQQKQRSTQEDVSLRRRGGRTPVSS